MELFRLLGTIAINNSGAISAIDDTTVAAEKSQSKLSGAFEKIGGAAVKVGKVVATGVAAGATAFGVLTTKAMNAAGELEQNMGGAEAVFGELGKIPDDGVKFVLETSGMKIRVEKVENHRIIDTVVSREKVVPVENSEEV